MKQLLLISIFSMAAWTSYGQTWGTVGNGLDDNVYDLIKFDNKLYACGQIGVKYWDGSLWTSLPNVSGVAYPLKLAVYEDALFVGGDFPWSGSISHVYKYDGTNWVQTGGDFDEAQWSSTKTLLPYNGQLVSGGRFSTINGEPVYNIASWDGSSWNSLGNGLNGSVYQLAEHNGFLYASGDFTASGVDTTVRHIGKWDGTNWSAIETTHSFNSAGQMIIFNGDLIIGSVWDTISGIPMKGIAKWTGSNFDSMGNNLIKEVSNFWVFNDELYLSGKIYNFNPNDDDNVVLKWNNYFWQPIGEYFNQSVLTIDDYNGELFCSGSFTACGITPIPHIARTNPSIVGISGFGPQPNFNFYPNPTSEHIVFNSNESGTITFSNQFGRVIKIVSINTLHTLIETSDISTGIYFLNFQTDTRQITSKLIKQ